MSSPRGFPLSALLRWYILFGNEADPLFDWDGHNSSHLRRNGVEPEEAEDAALDPGGLGAPAYDVGREKRSALLGATESGRVLFVVYTTRRGLILIVTARDATRRERRRYRRRGK
jgi:uncharacterized protein